jgi:hypothetical protein
MADNLLRLIAWQNPALIVLSAAGALVAASRRDPLTWPLVAGLALTTAAMTWLVPFQGHGWGYRYLHGLLGNLALLAASAWVRFMPCVDQRASGWARAGVATLGCAALALPLSLYDVHATIRPAAAAQAAIRRSAADVVLVDQTGIFYGDDLVRNDPWLATRPKVIDLGALTDDQARALCRSARVAIFDARDAAKFGVHISTTLPSPRAAHVRALLAASCGRE